MKIAAFSDVHSNIFALEAILADIAQQGDNIKIVVAGDFINCGPYPRETLQTIRALPNTLVIAGNHEEYVLDRIRDGEPAPPYRALFAPSGWTADQLSADDIEWLKNLPRQANLIGPDGADVMIVHGTPRQQNGSILQRHAGNEEVLEQLFEGHIRSKRLWISGHTHLPANFKWRGMTITNCGSAGMPFDSDWRASYLLIEWDGSDWQVENRRVAYDKHAAQEAMLALADHTKGGPFMRMMWYNLKISAMHGVNEFVRDYIARGNHPEPPHDFLHLEEAVQTHIRNHMERAS